jgi:hemerythrin superfamily protein
MDAITMLREDHRTVKQLFQKIDRLGDRANAQLEKLARQVVTELSIHSAIEEQLFYPTVRQYVPDTNDTVLESLEEHHVVKWVLSEIDGMQPSDERFRAKLTVLKESVLHHAEEEEQELFPKVRAALGRAALRDLGQMEDMLPIPDLPHQGHPGRLGAGVHFEAHRLHRPAHPLLQTDGERVAAVRYRLAAPQQRARSLLAARHQQLLALIQDKDGHAVGLLTELVTRAVGPSPLAHVVEQRCEQACFVATPRCPADLRPVLRAVRTEEASGRRSCTSRST